MKSIDFCLTIKYNYVRHNKGGAAGVSPRTGRPTSNPKEERYTLRLDNECSEIINSYCREKSVSKSEAIRTGIKKLKGDITKK